MIMEITARRGGDLCSRTALTFFASRIISAEGAHCQGEAPDVQVVGSRVAFVARPFMGYRQVTGLFRFAMAI
jgi:hypothetical protein